MNVQMMQREGKLDPESLRIVQDEVQRMKIVMDELLDFSRTPASSPVTCDIGELAGEVLRLMKRQFEHCGIVVKEVFRAKAYVKVDTNQMKQVIMNLLLNALQAMPGGGCVTVRTEDRGGATVRCSVCDTGLGVGEVDRDKLFQPFFSTREGGTGLGLAICRRIIEECGGEIGLENREDGATFWFELPVA
jgi:signal transduction histidine kinase